MRRRTGFFLALFGVLDAGIAVAQPGPEQVGLVKNEAIPLPDGARLRLGKLAGLRYNGRATAATLSEDGSLLAVVDRLTAINIVNVQTGKIVQTLQGKGGLFGQLDGGMTFSADNAKLVALSADVFSVWELAGGKKLTQVNVPRGSGFTPAVSRDGKIVAVGVDALGPNQKAKVQAFDTTTGKTIAEFETVPNVEIGAALSHDGKLLAGWGMQEDGMGMLLKDSASALQIWDIARRKELAKIDFMHSEVTSAAFTPDGKTVAALTMDGKAHLIDTATGKIARSFAALKPRGPATLRISPDGVHLVAFDNYPPGGVHACTLADGKPVALVDAPRMEIAAAGFPGKGRIVLAGMLGSALHCWEATDPKNSRFEGNLAPINSIAFSADGRTLVSGSENLRVVWWNEASGREERRLTIGDIKRVDAYGTGAVALTPDGKQAAAAISGGDVQLWDLAAGKMSRELKGPGRVVPPGGRIALAFAANASKLSVAGQFPPGIWDVASGERFSIPLEKKKFPSISDVALTPDGKIAVIRQRFSRQSESEVVFWDVAEKKQLNRINIPETANLANAGDLAFCVDGSMLAVADGLGAVHLFKTASGRAWRRLMVGAPNSATRIAFSPDGRFLATAATPRIAARPKGPPPGTVIEIWELASGHRRHQFRSDPAAITCLAFSPDIGTLASASRDTTILLWDIAGKNAKTMPLAQEELPAAWKVLAAEDDDLANIMRRLTKSPASVAFLKEHLQPVKLVAVDQQALARFVADLDAGDFKARAAATRELKLLSNRAEAELQKGLARTTTIEGRRRIQDLLDYLDRPDAALKDLQAIRGIEVLERIGNSEARELLAALAKGDPVARVTQEAAAALKRLKPR